ncbi:MAG: flagellar hook-length control protein FliK [Phycisphaerae bacterium]|nr:flagellar hook-length control protein FliK [Phycisphaerae bacterium]
MTSDADDHANDPSSGGNAESKPKTAAPRSPTPDGADAAPDPDTALPPVADPRAPGVTIRGDAAAPAVSRALEVERSIADAARGNAKAVDATGASADASKSAPHAPGVPAPAPLAHAAPTPEAMTTLQPSATPEAEADPTPLTARALGVVAKQQGGTLTMRLDPPSLGDLRVTMTIERGSVVADITPSTRVAHDLLSNGLTALREALERQGLHVERLSVHAPPAKAEQPATTSPQPNHASPTPSGPERAESRGDARHDGSQDSRRGHTQHDAGGGASRGRDDQRDSGRGRERGAQTRRASFAQALESVPF